MRLGKCGTMSTKSIGIRTVTDVSGTMQMSTARDDIGKVQGGEGY